MTGKRALVQEFMYRPNAVEITADADHRREAESRMIGEFFWER